MSCIHVKYYEVLNFSLGILSISLVVFYVLLGLGRSDYMCIYEYIFIYNASSKFLLFSLPSASQIKKVNDVTFDVVFVMSGFVFVLCIFTAILTAMIEKRP
jgi:hypothetical protein